MMITQPLQVLSIARQLSKRSGNKLTRFRVVRVRNLTWTSFSLFCMNAHNSLSFSQEPDQQRLLNFGSFAFQDSKTASEIININQSSEIQVPMNSRTASNYETLVFATEKKQDREIGLIEVASMVGLPLNITGRQTIRQKIEDDIEGNQDVSQNESDSEIKYVLAPISESKDDAVFYATVKCERRQAGEYLDMRMSM
jgi:hypothetical protein